MNFQDLLTKMKHLDEAPIEECGTTDVQPDVLLGEKPVEECGMPGMDNMPSGMMGAPKQQDNVTMNVSMNGSGAGGIRDLMDILRNLEDNSAPEHDHSEDDILVGIGEEQDDGGFQSATTEPDEHTQGVDAITGAGNDIHSQGSEAPKVNGGGNPFAVNESLITRLSELYTEIKKGR